MSRGNKFILIQENDIKSQAWVQAAKRQNLGNLVPISGSPMSMPFLLIGYILRRKIPDAIIFRYLNDYPSLLRTMARTFTDLFTIFLAKLNGVSILWICHNVDKESFSHYPMFTQLRREVLKKFSKIIFVMDTLLVKPCIKILGVQKERVDSLCFGRTDIFDILKNQNVGEIEQTINKIRNWHFFKKRQKSNALIGLWIGNPTPKRLRGLKVLAKIANQISHETISLGFLIIGPIGQWLRNIDSVLYYVLNSSANIMFIDQYVDIPARRWKEFCDFVWKPNDDWSITLTAYNSAVAGLPIVAFEGTFLGNFICNYQLGVVLNPENPAIMDLIKELCQWNPLKASRFLDQKTWDFGAKQIFNAVAKT